MKKVISLAVFCAFALVGTGCSPKVGSEAWCKKMDQKPKGEWTMDETGNYAKFCLLKSK